MTTVIETKVIAAAAGSGGGATLSAFLVWFLGVTVWGASADADKAQVALAAVPTPVSAIVAIVVTVVVTAAAGWLAPHTSRAAAPVAPLLHDVPPAV